ncbi:MAG: YbjQ family protein [Peptoniphilaceae bacterium]|nr:YbjQ family protein [Peptoniphilaceae bacterium]MDY6019348.1 YbjQ family protein [Anaerococcus sp.]
MILTTTNNIEGHEISQYMGLVFGEVIEGMNFLKDLGAGLRNLVGGRSQGYENSVIDGRNEAINELTKRAEHMGADAVIGIKFDYEAIVEGMVMITCSGTAVKLN